MLPFSQTPLKSTSVACSGLQFTDGTVSVTEVIRKLNFSQFKDELLKSP